MVVIVVVLLAVAATYGAWLAGPTGRLALATVKKDPAVLLAGMAVLVGELVIEHLPDAIAVPWFKGDLAGISLALSLPFLLMIALHVAALTWLVRRVAAGAAETSFVGLAGSIFVILAAIWVAIFGSLAILIAIASAMGEAMILLVIGWSLLQAWFAGRTAPLLAAVVRNEGRFTGLWDESRALYRARRGRWLRTALVELVLLGAVTFVYYEGPGRTSTDLHANATSVAPLSIENQWPGAIASAMKEPVPEALSLLVKAATAIATTIFVCAYLRLGEDARVLD